MSFLSRRTTPAHSKWYADQSPASLPVHRVGDVVINDEGNGIRSASFDGNGDYLRVYSASGFTFGTGDFTAEFWIYPTVVDSAEDTYLSTAAPTDYHGFVIGKYPTTNKFNVWLGDGSSPWKHGITSTETVVAGRWYHVALCSASGVATLYINGVSTGSATYAYSLTNTNNSMSVGGRTVASHFANCRMTGVRVVKGIALYTSNFIVPTTLPTAVAGTSLLLNFGATTAPGWFGDSSTALTSLAASLSSAGGVTLVNEGFGARVANFSNGYLQGGSTPDISSGDHTVEMFVSFSSNSMGFQPILARYFPGADNRTSLFFTIQSNNTLAVIRSTNGTSSDNIIPTTFIPQVDIWYHLALTVASGTAYLFVNGIQLGSTAWGTAYNTSQIWQIGRYENYNPGGVKNFTGKLAGLRVTNTALYTTNFVYPTVLPSLITGTQMLLNFGATSAPNIFANTVNSSTVSLSSFAPKGIITLAPKPRALAVEGAKAAHFNGSSGNYLRVAETSNDEFTFGFQDFTIEFWIKQIAASGEDTWFTTANPTDYTGIWIGVTSGKIVLLTGSGGSWPSSALITGPTPTSGEWYHIAATSSSGIITFYINGTSVGSCVPGFGLTNSNNLLSIGGRPNSSQYTNGYITGIRVVKGTALYKTNFSVPTTLPTVVPNTVLLMNFDEQQSPLWHADTSSLRLLSTMLGTVNQYTEPYWLTVLRSNGQGNITYPDSTPLGGDDFDVSLFTKFNNALSPADEHLVLKYSSVSNGIGYALYRASDGTIRVNRAGSGDVQSSLTKIRDTNWHYIQSTRTNNTWTLCIDGVVESTTTNSNSMPATADWQILPHDKSFPAAAEVASVRISTGSGSGSLSATTVPVLSVAPVASTKYLLNFGSTIAPELWYGDTSVNPRRVILFGGVTQVDEGAGTNVAAFNGTSGYLSAGNISFGTGDFTVEMFTNIDSSAAEYTIFAVGQHNGGFQFYYRKPTNQIICARANIANLFFFNAPAGFLDSWHHVAAVRLNGVLAVYVDGILIGSGSNTTDFGSGSIRIGYYPEALPTFLTGRIAGVRISSTAVYTSNFPVPATPLGRMVGTQLLLNFGASSVPRPWHYNEVSTNSAVLTGTPIQYDYGNGIDAAMFDGNKSYIICSSPLSGFAFGTGDWTAEFFVQSLVNPTGVNAVAYLSNAGATGFDTYGMNIGLYQNKIILQGGTGGGTWLVSLNSTTNIIPGRWYHVAASVSGGVWRLFLNGILEASTTNSLNLPYGTGQLFVGGRPIANQYSVSRLAGVRVVKGTALYTSNFAVPNTLPINIPGTTLLLNFGGTAWSSNFNGVISDRYRAQTSVLLKFNQTNGSTAYVDSSPNNYITTNIGTGAVSTAQAKYGSASYLGASNSYFTVGTDNTPFEFGTRDFTIEFWVYPTSFASQQNLILFANLTNSAIIFNTSGQLIYQLSNINRITSTALTLNAWAHVAISRISGNTRMFINGILQTTVFSDSTNYLSTGTQWQFGGNAAQLRGYMDDLCVTKGVGKYITSFIPQENYSFALAANEQSGFDVVGDATDDSFGQNVATNAAGNYIIAGSPRFSADTGSAKVYQYIGSNWIQLGNPLSGTAISSFGSSVCMNNDGNIIAVGAPGVGNGSANVYSLSGLTWNRLGTTTNLSGAANGNQYGYSVSLNAAGTRLAVGARAAAGDNLGSVYIYNWNGSTWSLTGNVITGTISNEQLGYSVSLNSAGDKVVIGSAAANSNTGVIRAYSLTGSTWTQIGNTLSGEATGDYAGYSVCMNAAGDILAFGSPGNNGNGIDSGSTRVYYWNGTAWIQMGTDIDGEAANNSSGNSVYLNAKGDRIVIGAPNNSVAASFAGNAKVYSWNGSSWIQLGADMDGILVNEGFGTSVSMNSIGDRIVVGAPRSQQSVPGRVRTYTIS